MLYSRVTSEGQIKKIQFSNGTPTYWPSVLSEGELGHIYKVQYDTPPALTSKQDNRENSYP